MACVACMARSSARVESCRRSGVQSTTVRSHYSLTFRALACLCSAPKPLRRGRCAQIPNQRAALHSTCAVGRARHTKRLIPNRMDLAVPDIENVVECLERHMLRHAATRHLESIRVNRSCSGIVRQPADSRIWQHLYLASYLSGSVRPQHVVNIAVDKDKAAQRPSASVI